MRHIPNDRLIKRNALIARACLLGGMAVLMGGMGYSFWGPRDQISPIPFITLVIGFTISNIGIYFSNRFARLPRPDQALDAALKGLDDRYAIYHYRLGTAHALICPAGIFALVPKFQGGDITFTGGRWRHRGTNALVRLFGQEGIGNPTTEAAVEADSLAKGLAKLLPGESIPPVEAIVVFTHPQAVVLPADAPVRALHARKLKEHLRGLQRRPSLSPVQIAKLDERFGVA